MSLSDILSSALSGLGASQAGMRTVSNNIANVNTAGYAREKVSQQPNVTNGRTSGVAVGEPTRVADRYLEETVYVRSGDAGRTEVVASYLDRLQSLLGANGTESALPARIDAISAAATAMTGAAAGTQGSAAFIGDVSDALNTMRQLQGDVSNIRADVDGEVGSTVDRINALLSQISDLNDSVARLSGLGRSTAGPADQRTAALQELSGLIGITAREQSTGRVAIETTSGIPLLDQRLRKLSYAGGTTGTDQAVYAPIEVQFADSGTATGERIDSPAIGGKLGGLLDLRDTQLPGFTDKLGALYGGLSRALNAASNASTAVPAPATLEGRTTALAATDRLGFTGKATFAVTATDGTLVAKTSVDFAALGAGATVADAITAINAGLGGTATASFTGGKLTIAATGTGNGVVVAQDADTPSDRAGIGFSHYFGLNDLVVSQEGSLAPAGFVASDPHGFAGGDVDLVLRDASGRQMARATLTPVAGGSFGALVDSLNASSLGGYGTFSLDDLGRVRFDPVAGNAGATLAIRSDTTDRAGTGRSFSDIASLTGDTAGLASSEVRRDVVADPKQLAVAQFQDVAVGSKALGTSDRRGALAFADALAANVDLGKDGTSTITRYAISVLGTAGSDSSRANSRMEEMAARRDDAVDRRDTFSGVNIDEELGQMVILQNSYSAAARVMTTASQMYDSLIAMVN